MWRYTLDMVVEWRLNQCYQLNVVCSLRLIVSIIHIVVATGISQLCSLYPAIHGVMGSISLQGNWQVASKSPM